MSNALQVIASGLLLALMGRNGGVSGGSSQIFAVLVGNMVALTVHVALGEPKVDDVDEIAGGLSRADEEVIGLDVTVDDSLGVNLLEVLHELDGDQEHGLDVKLAFAVLEQIFEGGSQEVHDHDVHVQIGHRVVCADVVEEGNAS